MEPHSQTTSLSGNGLESQALLSLGLPDYVKKEEEDKMNNNNNPNITSNDTVYIYLCVISHSPLHMFLLDDNHNQMEMKTAKSNLYNSYAPMYKIIP